MEIIESIAAAPFVSSLETLVQDGRTVQYKINLALLDSGLYHTVKKLWGFGVISMNNGTISVNYLVRPQELGSFYQKLKELSGVLTVEGGQKK